MSKLTVKTRFGTIPNEILNDERLSLRAKGLYGFIQSKPDGWLFSSERIAEQSKDGRDSVREGLKELEQFGLLERVPIKDETTKRVIHYDYVLNDKISEAVDGKAADGISGDGKAADGIAADGKSVPFSNKEYSKKEKEKKTIASSGDFFALVYAEFRRQCRSATDGWMRYAANQLCEKYNQKDIANLPKLVEKWVEQEMEKNRTKYLPKKSVVV